MTTAQKIIKYAAITLAILLIVALVATAAQLIAFLMGGSSEKELAAEPTELVAASDGSALSSLKIELFTTKMNVIRGESLKIMTNDPEITATLKKGELSIREPERKRSFFGIQFGSNSTKLGELTLTLPEVLFEHLELSSGVGAINVDLLSAKTAEMDFGVGDVLIERLCISEALEIKGGVGDLVIEDGALHNLSVEMGVGDASLSAILTGKTEIEMGIGKVELAVLDEKENYTVILESGIGKAEIDGEGMSDGTSYGDGANRIEIEGGIGSISLHFLIEESTK